jgi:hypothetical protein
VRQVWEGGERRLGISRETVRSATSMPSFMSRHGFGGAPQEIHRGHCSDESGDLGVDRWTAHPRGRPESLAQCSRKRRRCHRRTVSGATIRRGCLHRAQTLASQTQRRRSVVRRLGRVAVLLYTASW